MVSADEEAWYTRPCWNFVFLACAGDPQIITFVKRELFPTSLDIMEESFDFKEALVSYVHPYLLIHAITVFHYQDRSSQKKMYLNFHHVLGRDLL